MKALHKIQCQPTFKKSLQKKRPFRGRVIIAQSPLLVKAFFEFLQRNDADYLVINNVTLYAHNDVIPPLKLCRDFSGATAPIASLSLVTQVGVANRTVFSPNFNGILCGFSSLTQVKN